MKISKALRWIVVLLLTAASVWSLYFIRRELRSYSDGMRAQAIAAKAASDNTDQPCELILEQRLGGDGNLLYRFRSGSNAILDVYLAPDGNDWKAFRVSEKVGNGQPHDLPLPSSFHGTLVAHI